MKAKKSYKKGGKMTPRTLATAKGSTPDSMSRKNFMEARGRSAEHMRGTAQMAGKDDKPADSLRKRKYKKGGKVSPMKKKEVTGVNAVMASTRGAGIRGSKPVISKVTGTTSSKKGGDSGSSNDYKMRKSLKGTKTDHRGNHTRYVGMKNGGKVVAQGADKTDVRREKKQDKAAARAVKKAKRVGDRNFKRDVKSGKLKKA